MRQTPYKHLLDLNIQQNEWSLNKLMQEPDLIRSLSGMYKSETSLTNKRVDSYDTDKIFERGESVTRMFKNVSDGISNFTPKPKFSKGCNLCVVSCPWDVLSLNKEANSKGYNYSYMLAQIS